MGLFWLDLWRYGPPYSRGEQQHLTWLGAGVGSLQLPVIPVTHPGPAERNSWFSLCIWTCNLLLKSPVMGEPPDFTLWIRLVLLSGKIIASILLTGVFMQVKFAKRGTHFVWRCDSHAPISHVTDSSWIVKQASPQPSVKLQEEIPSPAGDRRRSIPAATALECSHSRKVRRCGLIMDSGRKYSK